jgi:hypothetical protein
MLQLAQWLFALVGLMLAAPVVIFIRRLRRPRPRLPINAELANFAQAKGWSFAQSDAGVPADLPTGWLRALTSSPSNVVRGVAGQWPFTAYEMEFAVPGDNEPPGHVCAILVEMPVPCPAIYVGRRGAQETPLFGPVKAGSEVVQFESVEFDRRYRVSASNTRFAYDVLDATTLQGLLDLDAPSWELTSRGLRITSFQRLTPTNLLAYAKVAEFVMGGIGEFVWHQLGAVRETRPVSPGPAPAA